MSGSTFGHMFRVTTFGESHGGGLGAIVDGCPPGLALSAEDLQPDLDRRAPGRNPLGTTRREADEVRILSGVADGLTTGTAIGLLFDNTNARPKAYDEMARLYRPSHADYTYQAKYGHRARSGGGRASARETVARVAAGAIARKLLAEQLGVEIVAWVDQVADVVASVDPGTVTRAAVAAGAPVECPDAAAKARMQAVIEAARGAGDTVGGIVRCVARGVPAGLGDPVFDKLDARLAYAMLGLPAAKGFDLGSGFAGILLRGSEHNDPFVTDAAGRVVTTTNRSGGVQGGISNGMPLDFRVAFKPVATHFKAQQTVTEDGEPVTFTAKGRHDPCVLPRAVVIVEAMTALVLADAWLRQRGQVGA
ncbi:MAG: chorismate synthase [Deltaproteobacteria bacterium]|nr:MAG: chorismate synthase [Deltaproteobacteria bacterium]